MLVASLVFGATPIQAADGWTYEILSSVADSPVNYPVINDRGEVAYVVRNPRPGGMVQIAIRVSDGITTRTVLEETYLSPGSLQNFRVDDLRLDNRGVVTFEGFPPSSTLGVSRTYPQPYRVVDGSPMTLVSSALQSYVSHGGAVSTVAAVNGNGQTSFATFEQLGALIVSDGITDRSTFVFSGVPDIRAVEAPREPAINESGVAAAIAEHISRTGQRVTRMVLFDANNNVASEIALGVGDQWRFDELYPIGFNELGFASYQARSSPARVLLVSPPNIPGIARGSTELVTTAAGQFSSLFGASALNDYNQVAFGGIEAANGRFGFFITDSSGVVLPVFRSGESLDAAGTIGEVSGSRLNPAMSNHGQIAFIATALGGSGTKIPVVVRATPIPGLLPSRPINPAPADQIPGGGWRIGRMAQPVRAHPGSVSIVRRAANLDPPIATGYVYTMEGAGPNFASVTVPAPLARGDANFTVEHNGFVQPLVAGQQYFFTDSVAAGVRSFRITGINPVESLDPSNSAAFVTRVTFLAEPQDGDTLTMVPIVENANPDTTAPTIEANVSGTLGNNGWYTSDVQISWKVADSESPITSSSGCVPSSVTADTGYLTFTCAATSAGGSAQRGVTIKRDATAPRASALISPPPNANGWNNADVTVTFSGMDTLSGSGIATCSPTVVLSNEGSGLSAMGNCVDLAGNTSTAVTVANVKIDKTAPTVAILTPKNGGSYVSGDALNADYSCSDAMSGVASCSGTAAKGAPIDTATAGNKTFAVSATDLAGNASSQSNSYAVSSGVDTTPPIITPTVAGTLGNDGWYRSNVLVAWNVRDAQSPISSMQGCDTRVVTSDTRGRTITCSATSAGGTDTASVDIKRDTTPPEVMILWPRDGSSYEAGQQVTALYFCLDRRSGIANCVGTVPFGTQVDTEGEGAKSFTVDTVDRAGNAKSSTVRYFVR